MYSLTGRISTAARTLRSFLPVRGTKEEKINFVKFSHSESEKELSDLGVEGKENGTIPDGYWSEGELSEKWEQNGTRHVRHQITEWQAAWNVTNAIQGMFIVSFPYAVVQGGYWAIFAMMAVAYICCHTGKILIDCLYEEDSSGRVVRVRNSYVAIAEEVWGRRFGGRIVNCAQLIELLMTCILYVLLCGDLIVGSFPNTPVDLTSWIMICTAPLLACAFLKSLRRVSWLSFWCTVAHMIINAIILIYCFTRAAEFRWTEVQLKIDIWTFPISMGIVVFSYTSQIFLPTLEGNMIDRSRFNCMMHWTHIAAALFKAIFSYIGFLTWGFATKEVITNNLPTESLRIIVNIILIAKAMLSYPLPFFAAVELLQATFFQGKPQTPFPSCFDSDDSLKPWGLTLRMGLVIFNMLMAIFIPKFALLMGLIGSFTGTMLSFVWPCYFHMKLKWHTLRWHTKVQDVTIIIMGIIFGAMGVYYSGHALERSFHGESPKPFNPRPLNDG